MEVLCGLLSCALWPPLCTSLGKQYNYIRKHKEHKENLQNELERLKSRGNDINDELSSGRLQHGKNPKKEVILWLEKWQKLVNDIERMDTENGNGLCLRGLCPNCYSRLKQSKCIEKLISDVKGLLENGQFSDGLFAVSLAEDQDSLPATDIQGSTAERKRDEIMRCIMDPKVSKIGVYGMGGVGKTTIMTNIYNQLKEKREFDIVMWVSVSSFFKLEKLQDIIAEELGCNLSETSREKTLYAAFRRRKNFLIFFDDMWDNIRLEEVGIPEPNKQNGSKIVWTTRFIKVCNKMESQRDIKVECLLEEEAWSLFKEKVGGENVISSKIEPTAREVAKECGGLPLALITVGRALRKTNQLEVWRSALEELKSASNYGIEDIKTEVFPSLKFSYDRLSNDAVRECFLYCALYPEDYDISANQLIQHWMAEGLIGEVGSWEKEKDKGNAILKELKDACMIESYAWEVHGDSVRMHDLIHDLAIDITKKQARFMVKAGFWRKESPKEEEWVESLERVSLMGNEIETLHGQPNCPQLLTLFLQNNIFLNNISETFFKYMDKLKVLNLSSTQIESFPNALFELTSLHELLLGHCRRLKCLPSLAKLHKLRVLDLRYAPIEEVPHGLENLVNLRVLNLSFTKIESLPDALSELTCLHELLLPCCWILMYLPSLAKLHKLRVLDLEEVPLEEVPHGLENLVKLRHLDISGGKRLRSFPSGILSKLTNLEHLLMGRSGWRWPYSNEDDKDKATVAEIMCLENLTKLSADFSDVMSFNSYSESCRWEHLEKSDFLIGRSHYGARGFKSPHMCLVGCDFRSVSVSGVKLPSIIQYLQIIDCDAMEWIDEGGEIGFPNLQRLKLSNLLNFQGLCKQKAQQEAFRNLEELHVSSCHQLKSLIPYDLLQDNLQNLKVIDVRFCREMKEIISYETGLDTVILPKLENLYMSHLPVLTSVFSDKLVCNFLSQIEGIRCPNLKKLPFSPALKKIYCTEEWWNTLEWDDPHMKQRLQPLVKYR